jgi:hypothetical protein
MSKPIFIIRFPYHVSLDKETFEQHYKHIGEQLSDYHVLAMIDSSVDRVEFECYNSEHTDIEFEQLKEQCLKTINKTI